MARKIVPWSALDSTSARFGDPAHDEKAGADAEG
jgi:hypothetical protein